jgi:hypothetical protein
MIYVLLSLMLITQFYASPPDFDVDPALVAEFLSSLPPRITNGGFAGIYHTLSVKLLNRVYQMKFVIELSATIDPEESEGA